MFKDLRIIKFENEWDYLIVNENIYCIQNIYLYGQITFVPRQL